MQEVAAEPRTVSQDRIEFIPAPYGGKNTSGYNPFADYVLVRVDEVKRQTAGGIHLQDDLVERYQAAAQSGVIIECGPGSFVWNADRTREFIGEKPIPGVHVLFERYAGTPIDGYDGNKYRLMPDKCISGKDNLGKYNHG